MTKTLDKLFGSKTRVKLLTLLLANPERTYYVREITRRLDERINSIRRELANLEGIGLVTSQTRRRKRYYAVNLECNIYPELRALILKIGVAPEERIMKQLADAGDIKFAVLSGVFAERENAQTDILIVGEPDKKKLAVVISQLEDEMEDELDYAILSVDEFKYRREMTDRFIMDIFNHDYMIVVDKLGVEAALEKEKQDRERHRLTELTKQQQLRTAAQTGTNKQSSQPVFDQ